MNCDDDFDNDNIADDTRHEVSAPLPRRVDDAEAKRQRTAALAAAKFDYSLLEESEPQKKPPVAANDNDAGFKATESWPVIELLRRTKQQRLIETACRIRELVDATDSDAMGHAIHRPGKAPTVDYDVQRTKSGKVFFDVGQNYDQRETAFAPRVIERSQPISNGFSPSDEFFAQRQIDAQIELDEIKAAAGPLWKYLEVAICQNATATEIGAETGAKGTQAPGVGTAIIKIGLEAAKTVVDAFREDQDYRKYVFGLKNWAPVSARQLKKAFRTGRAA
jgi:hypothetical protein